MYFGLAKISFDSTIDRLSDRKDLAALAEKVRTRFKVAVKVDEAGFDRGEPTLVVTSLHNNKEKLSQLMDAITKQCEEAGFGRLTDESAIIEHIDYFFEDQ